jgi:hypothetical protein
VVKGANNLPPVEFPDVKEYFTRHHIQWNWEKIVRGAAQLAILAALAGGAYAAHEMPPPQNNQSQP